VTYNSVILARSTGEPIVIKTLPLLALFALILGPGCGPDCPEGQEPTKSGECIPLGADDTIPGDDDDATADDDDTTPADDDDTTPADDDDATPGDDDDATPGDDDDATPGDDDDSAGSPPSLAADVQPILDASCTPCHIGGGSSGGLALDNAYGTLVGVPSNESALNRVAAGSTEDSYLWHKLQGTQGNVGGSGDTMPANAPPLPALEMDLIEAWILGGAQP